MECFIVQEAVVYLAVQQTIQLRDHIIDYLLNRKRVRSLKRLRILGHANLSVDAVPFRNAAITRDLVPSEPANCSVRGPAMISIPVVLWMHEVVPKADQVRKAIPGISAAVECPSPPACEKRYKEPLVRSRKAFLSFEEILPELRRQEGLQCSVDQALKAEHVKEDRGPAEPDLVQCAGVTFGETAQGLGVLVEVVIAVQMASNDLGLGSPSSILGYVSPLVQH